MKREDRALSEVTTLGLGGACRELVEASAREEVVEAVRRWDGAGVPWRVMGGGSNLLVADEGIPEAVLRVVSAEMGVAREEGGLVGVSGGASLDALAELSAEEGWVGLGFASGIPGTVGGGICGNAGAFGASLGDVLERVEVVERSGEVAVVAAAELGFDYRRSALQTRGSVITRAWFRVAAADRAALREERGEILAMRREKHPDWRVSRTAGSFFKNLAAKEPGGRRRAAGKLLEAVGAKEMRVGGAFVFPKHANIVMAEGAAKSADVVELARRMAEAVREKFGVALEPEVRYWF